MEWNYDFAVASLAILVVFQIFYLPHMSRLLYSSPSPRDRTRMKAPQCF